MKRDGFIPCLALERACFVMSGKESGSPRSNMRSMFVSILHLFVWKRYMMVWYMESCRFRTKNFGKRWVSRNSCDSRSSWMRVTVELKMVL